MLLICVFLVHVSVNNRSLYINLREIYLTRCSDNLWNPVFLLISLQLKLAYNTPLSNVTILLGSCSEFVSFDVIYYKRSKITAYYLHMINSHFLRLFLRLGTLPCTLWNKARSAFLTYLAAALSFWWLNKHSVLCVKLFVCFETDSIEWLIIWSFYPKTWGENYWSLNKIDQGAICTFSEQLTCA